jgi:hypothetical protein
MVAIDVPYQGLGYRALFAFSFMQSLSTLNEHANELLLARKPMVHIWLFQTTG